MTTTPGPTPTSTRSTVKNRLQGVLGYVEGRWILDHDLVIHPIIRSLLHHGCRERFRGARHAAAVLRAIEDRYATPRPTTAESGAPVDEDAF